MQPDLDDPVVSHMLARCESDEAVAGLLLIGSRSVGMQQPDSDYDFVVVTKEQPATPRLDETIAGAHADIMYASLGAVERLTSEPAYFSFGYGAARILLDKTGGSLRELIARIARTPEDWAREWERLYLDTYLNSFVRSMKAWRRGGLVAARVHSVDSVSHAVRLLSTIARRWAPYVEYWPVELDRIASPDWEPGWLQATVERIVVEGDSATEQELERRIEVFAAQRGVALEGWGEELARAKAPLGR